MIQSTVLVTGAGGAALPALIDGLHADGHRVIAVDADPNAVGLYLADRGYRIPFAAADEFVPALRRICSAEKVGVLIPLVDEELLGIAALGVELQIPMIGPVAEFTGLCLDKFELMRRMSEAGLPTPLTRLLSEGTAGMPFPLILKPRVGRGSRGIKIVMDQEELDEYLAAAQPSKQQTLVQTYVQGVEYTVSVVAWRDGTVRAVVPKEIVDKRGITRIAITRVNAVIDRLCRDIQERLRADGPFNVQLRIDRDTGLPMTFEINPRFSTTVTLTQASGVDEVGSLIQLALGGKPLPDSWQWRDGVTLLRRTVDSFIDADDFQERRGRMGTLP